jgi:small-conductance mechanosensitive channel
LLWNFPLGHPSRCTTFRFRAALAILLVGWLVVGAKAETKAPPAGLSQEQYESLVRDISAAVAEKLANGGSVSRPSRPLEQPDSEEPGNHLDERIGALVKQTGAVVEAVPALWDNTTRLPARLDRTAAGGLSLWAYLGLLAAAAIAVLAAPRVFALLTSGTRLRLIDSIAAGGSLMRLAGLAALDTVGVAAAAVIAHMTTGALFADAGLQQSFAASILNGMTLWLAYRALFRIFLRPGEGVARLAPVSDAHAALLYRLLPIAVALVIATRIWVGILVPPRVSAAATLLNSFIVAGTYAAVVWKARKAVTEWLLGLVDGDGPLAAAKRALAQNWLLVAFPCIGVFWAGRFYGALSQNTAGPLGTILTLNVILGLLLFETLFTFIERRARDSGEGLSARLIPFVLRSLRVLVALAAVLLIVRTWLVTVLNLVDEAQWTRLGDQWTSAAVTVLIAFLAWEAVRFATDGYAGKAAAGAGPADSDDEAASAASRLQTMVPLLRRALAVVIATIALLMVLTSLGVNIGPILAGASIVGLAISFGSQTLVRDIVSGIFYLADDAFRVGEYIDCGKAKGTVDGFTLRSLRLRHQNGQIHTIPFGQLGQVTNFSRDWSTVKFNLRFDRDVDLETLRKATKKVGQAMAEDPQFKNDILEPLKMQGVADIADNAMIVRFKFTVRPTRPTLIQRESIKRLIPAFKAAGIGFAHATVSVQTLGGPGPAAAAASAAGLISSAQVIPLEAGKS